MAQVDSSQSARKPRRTRLPSEADRLLDGLERFWSSLPEVASEIDRWDLMEQLQFTEEARPMAERHREHLLRLLAEGSLTETQQARLAAIEQLREASGPLMEQLLSGGASSVAARTS